MKLIRNIPFAIWMYANLIPIMKEKRLIAKYRREGNLKKEQEAIASLLSPWATKILDRYGVEVAACGHENIPKGPVLFVSNHQGYSDIIVFMSVLRGKQIGFVAKKTLNKVPGFGPWIRAIRSLYLSQDDSRAAVKVFQTGEQWLREGFSLVIFPEGHRSLGDGMNDFKKGSLRLATKAGVPIVPVSLMGTWHIYEERGYPGPGKVLFHIHPPIHTAGLSREELLRLPIKVEKIVRDKVAEWNREDKE